MRGRPRDLLDHHADFGMARVERGEELLHDLALASEPPEAHRSLSRPLPRACARQEQPEENDGKRGASQGVAPWSQPPVNPALTSPRTIAGFLRIVRHTSPLR